MRNANKADGKGTPGNRALPTELCREKVDTAALKGGQ